MFCMISSSLWHVRSLTNNSDTLKGCPYDGRVLQQVQKFTSKTGSAVATLLIDLGNRFRLIINAADCKKAGKPMPKLPVATAFWTPQPNLTVGAKHGFWQAGTSYSILLLTAFYSKYKRLGFSTNSTSSRSAKASTKSSRTVAIA